MSEGGKKTSKFQVSLCCMSSRPGHKSKAKQYSLPPHTHTPETVLGWKIVKMVLKHLVILELENNKTTEETTKNEFKGFT